MLSLPKYLVFGHRILESQQMHLPVNSTMVFCIYFLVRNSELCVESASKTEEKMKVWLGLK